MEGECCVGRGGDEAVRSFNPGQSSAPILSLGFMLVLFLFVSPLKSPSILLEANAEIFPDDTMFTTDLLMGRNP